MKRNDRDRTYVQEWANFWNHASTLSKKKEAKIEPAKEEQAWNAIRRWMRLYHRRWDSVLDYENFKFATPPDRAWDRVGEYGMSDDGDYVYEATNNFGKHGCPLSNDWVLEKSVPKLQRIGPEHYKHSPPILQIVRITRRKGCVGLGLSDGDFLVLGTLHRQLEYIIKKLRKFTIVKVEDYHIEYNPVPILHIRSMVIWNDVIAEKLRAPKPIARYEKIPQYL